MKQESSALPHPKQAPSETPKRLLQHLIITQPNSFLVNELTASPVVSLKTSFDFLASIHSHLYYTLLWVSACFKCVFFCFSFNTCAFRRLFPVLAVFSISTTTPFFLNAY